MAKASTPLPTTFKIGHIEMPIVYSYEAILKASEAYGGRLLSGYSNFQDAAFIVRPDMPAPTTRDTLLHEALHHMLNQTAMSDLLGGDRMRSSSCCGSCP